MNGAAGAGHGHGNGTKISEQLGLGPEVRELKFGSSFTGKASNFHTIRYDFKPASIDSSKMASLDVGSNSQVTISMPNSDGSGSSIFKGARKPQGPKECVLIIDQETGEITLEKIASNIQVKKTRQERPEGSNRGNGNSSSTSQGNKQLQPPLPQPQQQSSSSSGDYKKSPYKPETNNSSSSSSSSKSSKDKDVKDKDKDHHRKEEKRKSSSLLLPTQSSSNGRKASPSSISPRYSPPGTNKDNEHHSKHHNHNPISQPTMPSLNSIEDLLEPNFPTPQPQPPQQIQQPQINNNSSSISSNNSNSNIRGAPPKKGVSLSESSSGSDSSSSSSSSDSDSDEDVDKIPVPIRAPPTPEIPFATSRPPPVLNPHQRLFSEDLHLSDSDSD